MVFGQKIHPRALVETTGYVVVSPTNKNVEIQLTVYTGSISLFTTYIKGDGNLANSTKPSNFNGTMWVFTRFSDPPDVNMVTSPAVYPIAVVDLDHAHNGTYYREGVSVWYERAELCSMDLKSR